MNKPNMDAQMNYATGLEEDQEPLQYETREDDSTEKVSDTQHIESESGISFAQCGDAKKYPLLFSTNSVSADKKSPEPPKPPPPVTPRATPK